MRKTNMSYEIKQGQMKSKKLSNRRGPLSTLLCYNQDIKQEECVSTKGREC